MAKWYKVDFNFEVGPFHFSLSMIYGHRSGWISSFFSCGIAQMCVCVCIDIQKSRLKKLDMSRSLKR